MTDPDRIADMGLAINIVLTDARATNLEALAALAIALSVRLAGNSLETRAEACRMFTGAVMCAGELAPQDADACQRSDECQVCSRPESAHPSHAIDWFGRCSRCGLSRLSLADDLAAPCAGNPEGTAT